MFEDCLFGKSQLKSGKEHSTIRVPFGAWHEEMELELRFPRNWQVHCLNPADAQAISSQQIEESFAQPTGTEQLRKLAKGKCSAVIVVDDITRPTPVHLFLPIIINQLKQGGISQNRIQILIGNGAHRPMTRGEMAKKLGPDILAHYQPIMHDFMGTDIRYIGWLNGGPVYLNRHFLEADLRICVGAVIPHDETGFGGGAKMVVPGIAGRLTIAHFHGILPPRSGGELNGKAGTLDRRRWAEDVARYVDVDMGVCAVVNARRELAGLHVGDIVEAHRSAAQQAKEIGKTKVPQHLSTDSDVVVVNAYPLDTDPIQMGKSLRPARKLRAKKTVIIDAASDGIFYHGMGIGSGISLRRLLRNVPAWLTCPTNQVTWLRSISKGVWNPMLMARLSYFSLNHLSYDCFVKEGRLSQNGPIKHVEEDMANQLVYSQNFPAREFSRKYPDGILYRNWQQLIEVLDKQSDKKQALVLPCAPLQLVEIV